MGGGSCGKRHHCFKSPGCFDVIGRGKNLIFGEETSTTSSKIGQEESYSSETAQITEVARINKTLTEFRDRIEKKSDKIERDVLSISREYIDELIKELKKINNQKYAGQSLNLNIESIERQNRKTEDTIHGHIKKHIQKRISIDDEQCLEILKMETGPDKEKKMTNFINLVLKESMQELSKKIKKVLTEQADNITEKIEDRIVVYENSASEKISSCKEIINLKGKDEKSLEEKIGKVAYKLSLCELVDCVFEGVK